MSRVEVPIQSWQCYDCFPKPRVRTYNLVRIQSLIQKSYRFPVPPTPKNSPLNALHFPLWCCKHQNTDRHEQKGTKREM